MTRKFLEKRLLVENDDGIMLEKPIELEYYLVESCEDNMSSNNSVKTYGIGILKKINDNCYEERVVKDYSYYPDETKNVLKILACNSVTPDSLIYVLDDLLGNL